MCAGSHVWVCSPVAEWSTDLAIDHIAEIPLEIAYNFYDKLELREEWSVSLGPHIQIVVVSCFISVCPFVALLKAVHAEQLQTVLFCLNRTNVVPILTSRVLIRSDTNQNTQEVKMNAI